MQPQCTHEKWYMLHLCSRFKRHVSQGIGASYEVFPSRQLVVPDFFAGGVFCNWATVGNTTYEQIRVQAQVRGTIVDATGRHGSDMALYTGSTTGSSKSNTVCPLCAPVTWRVECKCRLTSPSSFDKMCADMKAERDDMSSVLYTPGSRVPAVYALVWLISPWVHMFSYLHEADCGSEKFVGPFCPISFDHIWIGLKKLLRQAVLAQMPGSRENKIKGEKKNLLLHHTRLHRCCDACTPDLALCPTPALHLGAIHKTARVRLLTQS